MEFAVVDNAECGTCTIFDYGAALFDGDPFALYSE